MIKNGMFQAFKMIYRLLSNTPLRKVPGMLQLSNKIFRKVWPEGQVISVQNNKMYIDINEKNPGLRYTFQAYAMNLVHEKETTRLIRQVLKSGDTVLDLGANIGYFTIISAGLVGSKGKVFCFEPEPTNFKYLKKNIELNQFKNVEANQKAISNKNGTTNLFVCTYDSGHHTINSFNGIEAYARGRSYEKKSITIETVRVDDYLKGKVTKVDVIKMDVEGAEYLALEGMKQTLKNNNVKVFLEYFPLLIKKMGGNEKVYIESLLNDFGFYIYSIGHDYDMYKSNEDFLKIDSYEQLAKLIVNEDDHVNLFLTKDSSPPSFKPSNFTQ